MVKRKKKKGKKKKNKKEKKKKKEEKKKKEKEKKRRKKGKKVHRDGRLDWLATLGQSATIIVGFWTDVHAALSHLSTWQPEYQIGKG